MWWQDLLWGIFNGFTAWIVWFAHLFDWLSDSPFYNIERSGGWYDFGFLVGTGSPLLGTFGNKARKKT